MTSEAIRGEVERYYSGKFAEHGPTARGVDWNGAESQQLRFEQLLSARDRGGRFSINDYGCGYGALAGFLKDDGAEFDYTGFDLSAAMLEHARATYPEARFVASEAELAPADYTVASGIFNVRLDTDETTWTEYVVDTVRSLWRLSTRACSFNMLTSYSDADRMRPDLYYGDPRFFFDLCKRELSRHVALLHDYGLWEFTLVVRREPRA